MDVSLSAPRTALEWYLFAALVCGFYLVFTYALMGEPLYATAIGFAGGLGTTAGVMLIVSTWRRLRPSATTARET